MDIKKTLFILLTIVILASCALSTSISNRQAYAWLETLDSELVDDWVNTQNKIVDDELFASELYESNTGLLNEIMSTDKLYVDSDGYYIFTFKKNGYVSVSSVLDKAKTLHTVDLNSLFESDIPQNLIISCYPKTTKCFTGAPVLNENESNWFEFDMNTNQKVKMGFSIKDTELAMPMWIDQDTILYNSYYADDISNRSKMALNLKRWKRKSNQIEVLLSRSKDEAITVETLKTNAYSHEKGSKTIPSVKIYSDYSLNNLHLPLIDGKIITHGIPKSAELLALYEGELLYWLKNESQVGDDVLQAGSLVSIVLDSEQKISAMSQLDYLPQGTYLDSAKLIQNHLVVVGFRNAEMIIGTINLKDKKPVFKTIYTHPVENIMFDSPSPYANQIQFTTESMLEPKTFYQYDLENRTLKRLKQNMQQFNSDGMVEALKFAKSRDGKNIPYRIVYPKNTQGNVDTIIYTSGVFGVSRYATYSAVRGKLWLEKKKAFIISHPRGGSEFGPQWYLNGLKETKINTVNDVADIAKAIVKLKITNHKNIALLAGRGGGAISGAVSYKYPELFKATYLEDSILDLINLADHSDHAEFGDPNTNDITYMKNYSPFQQIIRGKKYPLSLIVASRYDPEIHPANSRKTAKRLHDLGQKAYFYETKASGKQIAGNLKARIDQMMYTFYELALAN
jgi:prolyl oligopeptidase